MNKLNVLFIPALLALCTAVGAAQSPATEQTQPTSRVSEDVMNHVQQQMGILNTVEADFVEDKHLAMLDHTLEIHGHFAMQKPDRLVWIVKDPVKYAVSIQGNIVRQWDEDTDKVQTINIGGDPTFRAVSEQLSSWFMGNYKALQQGYEVSQISDKPLTLVFTPHGDSMVSKVLKQVKVIFAPGEHYIDTMEVIETGGSVTTIKYINVHLNEPVKDETWEIPPHDR